MRFYEISRSSTDPIPKSTYQTQSEWLSADRDMDRPRSKKITLKSIHKLKLRQKALSCVDGSVSASHIDTLCGRKIVNFVPTLTSDETEREPP